MPLSDREAKNAKWKGKDVRLSDGNGLYLNIRRSSKTWIIRSRRGGSTRITTVGKYPAKSLKEARLEAAKKQLEKDVSNVTVKTLIGKYMAEVVEKSHKRPEFIQGYIDRAIIPKIGQRKVRDVTTSDLVILIQEYAKRGARTADQLRSNLMALFGYGTELGYCDFNPMAGVTRRVSGYVAKPRERVLDDEDIRLIWGEPKPNARVFRFLLLTGLRIIEAQKGYQNGSRWIVPKEISKNGKAHWVYLTETAKAQLPLPKCTATNVQAWVRRWCDKHEIDPRFTPHDCRRTAATRMADAGVEPFIVERVLNHSMQGVMAVYNKAEYENQRIEAAGTLERVLLNVVKL